MKIKKRKIQYRIQEVAKLHERMLDHQSDLLRRGVGSPMHPEKAVPLSPTRGAACFRYLAV
jgi:hypothetical protein